MNKNNMSDKKKKNNRGSKSKEEILKQINEINPSLIKDGELDTQKFINLFSTVYI